MVEKRKKHELKIILILIFAIILFYGIAAGISMYNQANANDDPLDGVNIVGAISLLQVDNGTETYSLTRSGSTWYCVEDEDVSLNQSTISTMNTTFKDFEATRIIEDGNQYLAEFGLDDPQYIFTKQQEDGVTVYLVGNYNASLNEYYVMIEGTSQVYLISKSKMDKCTYALIEMIASPELSSVDSSSIQEIIVDGTEGGFRAYRSDDIFIFESEDGEIHESNSYSALNIYYGLKNLDYETCFTYHATGDDLSACGMDTPLIEVTIVYNDSDENSCEYVVKIAQGEDGNYYVVSGNEDVIYQLSTDDFDTINEKTLWSYFVS